MKRTSLDNIRYCLRAFFIFIIQYTQKEKISGGKNNDKNFKFRIPTFRGKKRMEKINWRILGSYSSSKWVIWRSRKTSSSLYRETIKCWIRFYPSWWFLTLWSHFRFISSIQRYPTTFRRKRSWCRLILRYRSW